MEKTMRLLPSRCVVVQSQQWKHLNNVWNIFKVNKNENDERHQNDVNIYFFPFWWKFVILRSILGNSNCWLGNIFYIICAYVEHFCCLSVLLKPQMISSCLSLFNMVSQNIGSRNSGVWYYLLHSTEGIHIQNGSLYLKR